jgi:hypothetical protein
VGLGAPWWGGEPNLTDGGESGSLWLALHGGAARPMADGGCRPEGRLLASKKLLAITMALRQSSGMRRRHQTGLGGTLC